MSFSCSGSGGGGSSDNPETSDPVSATPWLCFIAKDATCTVSTKCFLRGTIDSVIPTIMYSIDDGETWYDFNFSYYSWISGNLETAGSTVTLRNGEKVYIRAKDKNVIFSKINGGNNYLEISFKFTGIIAASGNVMSLLDKDCKTTTIPCNSCFFRLFRDCTSLTEAPELPSTSLTTHCYSGMFENCTSLTKAPDLPATTLTDDCYVSMFENCTSLTKAPELPATTLATNCYASMFKDCHALKYINAHFNDWGTSTNLWVQNVSPSGLFTCPYELPESFNGSRMPHGWTVQRLP